MTAKLLPGAKFLLGARLLLGAKLVFGLTVAALYSWQATASAAVVLTRTVTFTVQNVNRSAVPCLADGQTYRVQGYLVGPATALADGNASAATLYLHGLGFGAFFWRFTTVPGYDFATLLAQEGHVSVVVDRLGYAASDHPPGTDVCLGSHADIAHQIVQQLRTGAYRVDRGLPIAFPRVALAGHSAGGAIAQIEAYSFGEIDSLLVLSYADQGVSAFAGQQVVQSNLVCAQGGEPAGPGQPTGYAPFGQTPADFQALMFSDADPAVVAATTALRTLDPCGDFASLATENTVSHALIPTIHVPVLLLCGNLDAIFPPPACQLQQQLFTGAPDLSAQFLDGLAHAVTLERQAPLVRRIVSDWLSARGF